MYLKRKNKFLYIFLNSKNNIQKIAVKKMTYSFDLGGKYLKIYKINEKNIQIIENKYSEKSTKYFLNN